MKHEYYSILNLETIFPRHVRRVVEMILISLIAGLVIASFFLNHPYKYIGGALILGCLLVKYFLFDAFFFSTYIRLRGQHEQSFPLAHLLWKTAGRNPVHDFCSSYFGKLFLIRLGIAPVDFSESFKNESSEALVGTTTAKTLSEYFNMLLLSYPALNALIQKYAIQPRQIDAVGAWIERNYDQAIEYDRWWSKEHLSRIPGIGKDWAYGQTYILEKHGSFLSGYGVQDFDLYKKEIEELESVLSKSQSANALVVSDTDAIRLTIVQHLANLINSGKAYPTLERKKVFLLNSQETFSEEELTSILYEAERVGNIVFVIDNPLLLSLMTAFFRSSSVQCIALADTGEYYQKLQSQSEITSHFELIKVDIKDQKSVIQVIEDQVSRAEYQYGLFFSYPAVETIIESAENYFQSENLITKATNLVVEFAPHAQKNNIKIITKQNILEFVEMKTGIPAGKVTEIEKEKLLNLEKLLHERVVGQDEAIISISQAVRRSRSGLGKTNRPIGSFLFLGPTGVGKTETAKALGDIFFGTHVPTVRFDMSEFSNEEALSRLIGDINSRAPGLLANAVREHAYGLLLLDEFEKASKDVHNLFLQILDEGYFSDVQGRKVNLRNMIIIATSNAGSELITTTSGEKIMKKEEVIDQLVSRGDFRPELLNRFDGVIFFHSLGDVNLDKVTRLMLKNLSSRLTEKGIELVITDDLISVLMEKGNDPHFGARPMNRAIADLVEEKIAEGLISGSISSGSKISFVKDEIEGLKIK